MFCKQLNPFLVYEELGMHMYMCGSHRGNCGHQFSPWTMRGPENQIQVTQLGVKPLSSLGHPAGLSPCIVGIFHTLPGNFL